VRLASYIVGGRESYGVVTEGGVVDLGSELSYPDLRSFVAEHREGEADEVLARGTMLELSEIELLPVIPNPDKIFCVGLNYADHVAETGRSVTEHPSIFMRTSGTQVGHGQSLSRPRESVQLDFEGEIAVVIGKASRRIRRDEAWGHIAGFACYNDATIRDWQRHTAQWTPGKNFYRTGGFGPWMVTADEIPEGTVMTLTTRLNGEQMQHTTSDRMIFGIAEVIEYISTFSLLLPGDVIATGTPSGVGARREPEVWMRAGDKVEVEIDRVGVLINTVEDD
jgi:2-keto-4-pentenoate hydratase/2-oxohepta-3-ene-1,7-dioic acid hydratase in catechol pathway